MITNPFNPRHLTMMPTFVPVGAVIAFAGNISPPINASKQPGFTTNVESQAWMVCDGRLLKQDEYGLLYSILGVTYNHQNDDKTAVFRLPDYRGYFLRMVDMDSGNDPDASLRVLPDNNTSNDVGSIEQDALQYHLHPYTQPNNSIEINVGSNPGPTVIPANTPDTNSGEPVADDSKQIPPPAKKPSQPPTDYSSIKTSFETRPKNIYVYYIIKFM